MPLKMNEEDWEIALEVFRTCLPARGAKAKDDRLFLEELHFFAIHNISWRALPERFGCWNSVWKRFDRVSKSRFLRTSSPCWRASAAARIWCRCSPFVDCSNRLPGSGQYDRPGACPGSGRKRAAPGDMNITCRVTGSRVRRSGAREAGLEKKSFGNRP